MKETWFSIPGGRVFESRDTFGLKRSWQEVRVVTSRTSSSGVYAECERLGITPPRMEPGGLWLNEFTHRLFLRIQDRFGLRDLICEESGFSGPGSLDNGTEGIEPHRLRHLLNDLPDRLLDIEARAALRLKDGQDPTWFIKAFEKFASDHANDSEVDAKFHAFMLRGHSDRVEDVAALETPAKQSEETDAETPRGPQIAFTFTVKDAAKQFQYELRPKYDETRLSTLEARISKACTGGAILCQGSRRDRRISPESLDSYILKARNRDMEEDG